MRNYQQFYVSIQTCGHPGSILREHLCFWADWNDTTCLYRHVGCMDRFGVIIRVSEQSGSIVRDRRDMLMSWIDYTHVSSLNRLYATVLTCKSHSSTHVCCMGWIYRRMDSVYSIYFGGSGTLHHRYISKNHQHDKLFQIRKFWKKYSWKWMFWS